MAGSHPPSRGATSHCPGGTSSPSDVVRDTENTAMPVCVRERERRRKKEAKLDTAYTTWHAPTAKECFVTSALRVRSDVEEDVVLV